METTYKKVFEFRNAAGSYLATEKDETKLKTALEDVLEQILGIQSHFEKYSKRIKRRHAAEDRFGCILKEENGNYKYTKDGEEKAEEELEDMLDEVRDLEVEPVFVAMPVNFPRPLIKYFKGFVFE